MDIQTNIKLIEKMFNNQILFDESQKINNYEVDLCEDYDNYNLYTCKKKINEKINGSKYIKQLSKLEIRNSLFNSYLDISKLNDIDSNSWVEKIIYDNKNYNIQQFTITQKSLFCFSNLELDDNSFDYFWINNPYTLVLVENGFLILKIAFEVSNTYQKEILKNFLNCLDKLELALTN